MKTLCIDTFSIVLSFLNYNDYTILNLTNSQIKYLVDNLTTLPELLDIMRTENISWKQKEKLVYRCCSLKRTDIAKYIIAQSDVTLFPLRDIFFYNYCDRNDIRTIRRILKLKGVDVSKHEILKKKEYSDYLQFLEYVIEDTNERIESFNDKFIFICSFPSIETDIYVKIFYLFGNFKLLDIDTAFIQCYYSFNYAAMNYILSVYPISETTLIKILNNACKYNQPKVVEMLMSYCSFERKALVNAANICSGHDSHIILIYLFGKTVSDDNEKRRMFKIACARNSIHCYSILISSADMSAVREAFVTVCKTGARNIFQELFSKVLDQETIDQGFIQSCLSQDLSIAKHILKNRIIENNILLESFYKVCQDNKVDTARFLLKRIKIDNDSRKSILMDSCKRGYGEIIVCLLENRKLGLFERRDYFLECCRNKQIHLFNLFADPSFEFFIKHARKKVAKKDLIACFRKACLENNVEVVDWIFKMLDRIDEPLIYKIIKECTIKGNSDVVIWLLNRIQISDDFANKCFLESCKYGRDDIMKFFRYTGKIYNSTIQIGFSLSCQYDHSNIYMYLYVISNIATETIESTRYKCIHKRRHISARWLNNLLNRRNFQLQN